MSFDLGVKGGARICEAWWEKGNKGQEDHCRPKRQHMEGMQQNDVFLNEKGVWRHWGRTEGQEARKELKPKHL